MTQTIRTPDPPSEGVPDFHLIVMNETATIIERDFSALDETNAGLGVEVTARVDPSGAGRTLVFTGRPDLVACEGNEIVQFRLNDGQGWRDVFYGTIVEGWAAQPMDEAKTYTADADELLNGTVTDTKVYGPQDPALIAADLISRLRHPALKYDDTMFQSTGTTLEGGFEMPGVPLGQALEQLAKSVEDAGRSFAYGVDGRGYVFFREPTGVANILYRPEDVEGFEPLPVNARGTTTAVYWVIGNQPSQPNWTREYEPGTLAYLSVPDVTLHNRYGRVTGRTPTGNPFVAKARSSYTAEGFTDPGQGSDSLLGDVPVIASYATRSGTVDSFYQINGTYSSTRQRYEAGGLPIYGVRIRYQMDYDVPATSTYLWFVYSTIAPDGTTGDLLSAIYHLPYSNAGFTSRDYILPPPAPFTGSNGVQYSPRRGGTLDGPMLVVGAAGTFYLSDFRFLCLDTPLLDAAARRELFLPATEPATITPTRDTPDGLRTFYVEPRPQVQLFEYPGEPIAPAAEYRISFNEDFHAGTVIDLGSPNRDEDGRQLDQIRLGVDRKTRQSEVKKIGRVGR
jgi:hypothetical protein